MKSIRLKYCFSFSVSLLAVSAYSQQTNLSDQAVVTIVGDAPAQVNNNDVHDFINSNPYPESNEPQVQQQMTSQNIEPTLENGFHIRFELNSPKIEEPIVSSGFTSSSSTSGGGSALVGKAKKHGTTLEERSFNMKKRLKSWLPDRKRRYHPHLCGRF